MSSGWSTHRDQTVHAADQLATFPGSPETAEIAAWPETPETYRTADSMRAAMSSVLQDRVPTRKEGLMKTTLLMLLFVAAASSGAGGSHRANRAEPAITCETVRAYVSQMGLIAAKAIARPMG